MCEGMCEGTLCVSESPLNRLRLLRQGTHETVGLVGEPTDAGETGGGGGVSMRWPRGLAHSPADGSLW